MSNDNQKPNNNSTASTVGKYLLWGGLVTAGVATVPILLGFGTVG